MRGWVLVWAVLLAPLAAAAHGRSVSYSSIDVQDGGAAVRLRVTRLDRDALEHAAQGGPLSGILPGQLRLRWAAGSCAVEERSFHELEAPEGFSRFEWRVRCGGAPTAVESDLLFDVVPAHLHFTHVTRPGLEAQELLLTEDRRAARWSAATAGRAQVQAPWWQTFGQYFGIGVRHIGGGWDHLVFLFALVVLARSFGAVVIAATGFTAGHSLTLALAALGVVRPDAAAVEALVALSIVLVAVENVWLVGGRRGWLLPGSTVAVLVLLAAGARWGHRPAHLGALSLLGFALMVGCHYVQLARARAPFSSAARAMVAGLFGMVHGFAFAAVLLDAALPAGAVVVRLLGFNLGVEAGQLLVLAGAVGGFRLLVGDRWGTEGLRRFVQVGSAAAAAVGVMIFLLQAARQR